MKKIKWGTMVPLIGGSAIGCAQATGTLPQFHLSFDGFENNDAGILNYWKDRDIPYYHIDSDDVPLSDDRFQGIDFVNSVCPCAALARLNTSKGDKAGGNAPQNQWMYKSAEFVLSNIKPTVYWGENAPALNMEAGKPVVKNLIEIGKKHGYSFSIYKTSTLLHGLPQKRERCFYFFWKGDKIPVLRWFDRERKTYKQFILDIDKKLSLMDEFLPNFDIPVTYSIPFKFLLDRSGMSYEEFIDSYSKPNAVVSIINIIRRYGLIDELIEYTKENYPDLKKPNGQYWYEFFEYIKMKWDSGKGIFYSGPIIINNYCPAIISKNTINLIHPTDNRYLTYREICCLMGMPDDFIPIDAKGNHKYCQGYMIGQNVPVNTARDMAEEVCRYINDSASFEYVTVDNGYFCQNNLNKKSAIVQLDNQTELM